MREIEFRGKNINTCEWIYGSLVVRDYTGYTSYIIVSDDAFDWVDPYRNFEVKSKTIGQFTGLYDRNNSKIFEGDIVKLHLAYSLFIGVVYYEDCFFIVRGHYDNEKEKNIFYLSKTIEKEIIGNIYDSPELLEKNYE